MAMDFPNSPSINDTYTASGRTWIWNGTTIWRSSGAVTVNYADVLYNDADGASIPFSNVNGLIYGTTDWIDENIYPDYIILGMQD